MQNTQNTIKRENTLRTRLNLNDVFSQQTNPYYSIIGKSYKYINQFHNILRLLDVLPNFPSTTSETMGDYYL